MNGALSRHTSSLFRPEATRRFPMVPLLSSDARRPNPGAAKREAVALSSDSSISNAEASPAEVETGGVASVGTITVWLWKGAASACANGTRRCAARTEVDGRGPRGRSMRAECC